MDIAILIPVYNDWSSASVLLSHLDDIATRYVQWLNVDVHLINDFSTEKAVILPTSSIRSVYLTQLVRNLGHQRAIATGLSFLASKYTYDKVIVMDSDGEDRPEDIPGLLHSSLQHPHSIIVAQRAQRSEGWVFGAYYYLYKFLFWLLTGKRIDFGNFCLIPFPLISSLTHNPGLWNHIAATVMQSKNPLVRYKTRRGVRYRGKSKMNFSSLITHGLSAISIFLDVVAVRVFITICVLGLFVLLAMGLVVFLRLFTNTAIPGWATSTVGILIIIFVQLLTMSAVITFWVLNRRETKLILPARDVQCYVCDHVKIEDR